jgi:glycosyltransferase involved in cell wall biosynthesis/ADP-heptose:LPS heptosyltransferase
MPDPSYRLLQIFNRPLGGGGEGLATEEIARILSQDPGFARAIFQSAEWTGPQAPPRWKQAALTFYNPSAIRRLRAAQEKNRAQAWILHNYIPVVSGGVFHEAQRQQVPIIQYVHNFRPFSVSSYLWAGRLLDPAHWPANFVREIRYGAWQGSRSKTAFLAAFFTALHLTRQYRAIKAWVAVSKFMREKFISVGVAPESIFQLYDPWLMRCQDPDFPESDYYLFLARLIEEKGTKVVVNAWHRLRQLHPDNPPRLIIGGDGPLTDWVKAAAAENPLIEYRGHVSGREKDVLIQNSRASLVPSIWWDPAPFVCYEAYDFGKPVLAAASGGLTELVQHGRTGFHHTPGDAEQLARQVLELDVHPELRRQMGVNGRAWLAANTGEQTWRKGFFKIVDYAVGTMPEKARAGSRRRPAVTAPGIGIETAAPGAMPPGGFPPETGTRQNLLIFELRMMGDAIMSLPFIRAAQEKYRVFVCCQPSVSDVFRTLLPEEQVISWHPPWMGEEEKSGFSKWRNAGTRSLLQRLRKLQAPITLSVWADPRIHLLMALTGVKERIGFPMEKKNTYANKLPWRRRQIVIGKGMNLIGGLGLGRKLLTQKVHRGDYLQHHVEDWRQLAETLDLKWRTDPPWFEAPWFEAPDTRVPPNISEWLRTARSQGQKIWLLHPGARNPARRWPVERFRRLIEQTFLRHRIPLIVIDPMESPLPREWMPGVLIYRPGSLMEFFSIVSAIDYVVCNDTGVSHAAAALGKRVVCVFGANLPQWFAPYRNLDLVVQNDVCPHRPCLDHCVMPSYICLETVTVEMVQQQIEKLHSLSAQPSGLQADQI